MKAFADKALLRLGQAYKRVVPFVKSTVLQVAGAVKHGAQTVSQVWTAMLKESGAPEYKPPVYHPLPGRELTFRERALFNFVIGGGVLLYLGAIAMSMASRH